jgi:uncharacterized oligopeptide transporter (OPT) family protein
MSPMMLGTGVLVGPAIALSMLLGAVIAWGVLGPWALGAGEVAHADFNSLVAWLLWPGVALMVSGAMAGLALQGRAFVRTVAAIRERRTSAPDPELSSGLMRAMWILALLGSAGAIGIGAAMFGLHPLVAVIALGLSVILAEVVTRAAGATDFAPLGQMGQLTQAAFGPLCGSRPTADIAAGALAGDIGQTQTLVYMFRAARDLSAPPRSMVFAVLIGVLAGSAVCVPAYALIVHAYGLGSEALPAASARTWSAMAAVVTGHGHGVPLHATQAAWIAAGIGVVLALLARARWGRRLPSAVAMGVAFIIPAHYSVTIALGALLFLAARRRWPGATERLGTSIGSGAIAGEALMGVLIAVLISTGVLKIR